MKAIILAAGKGLRMGELTKSIPKPLLTLSGKPILERNLENLTGLVEEAIIVVGHLREKIISYFGNDFKGIKITYIIQKEQLGTGDAIMQVINFDRKIVKDKFILMMGDDIYSKEDVKRCLEFDNSILATEVEDPSRFGVFLVKDGIIKEAVEKPKKFISNIANAGLYVFNGITVKELKKSERGEIEFTDVVKDIVTNREVRCILTKRWISIAYPDDIKKAEALLKA